MNEGVTTQAEPLTPEEEANLRERIAERPIPDSTIDRLLATFDRERAARALPGVDALAAYIQREIDKHGSHNPGTVCIECGDERPWKTVMRDILAALPPDSQADLDWPTLANVIREVDGNHDLAAGELAERILSHPRVRGRLLPPDSRAEREAAAAERERLTPILDWALDYLEVNDEPCWFDHHGGCQAHGYLDLEPGEECPQGAAQRARAALAPAAPVQEDSHE